MTDPDPFILAGKKYTSRLLVGTGLYKTLQQTREAIQASGAEIVTVALRRIDLTSPGQEQLQDYIRPDEYTYLPNSAGCYTAEDAVRTLRLARQAGNWNLVKLEVIGEETSLYPNIPETIKAAEILVNDGFDVMAYTNDDPIAAQELENIGCTAIMPLAAPIGSGLGIQNQHNIERIIEQSNTPVLIDAGIGTTSDATIAMEMGCDAVLLNSAIAKAKKPVLMAHAMKHAVEAGRLAYRAGRMSKQKTASASSPKKGVII